MSKQLTDIPQHHWSIFITLTWEHDNSRPATGPLPSICKDVTGYKLTRNWNKKISIHCSFVTTGCSFDDIIAEFRKVWPTNCELNLMLDCVTYDMNPTIFMPPLVSLNDDDGEKPSIDWDAERLVAAEQNNARQLKRENAFHSLEPNGDDKLVDCDDAPQHPEVNSMIPDVSQCNSWCPYNESTRCSVDGESVVHFHSNPGTPEPEEEEANLWAPLNSGTSLGALLGNLGPA